jgi:dTDP-4-amino-4,6-dideoxygalactose transaminase
LKKVYRPAGNSVVLKKAPVDADLFSPFRYRLFQSGTASLAAAIAACMKLKNVQSDNPEIILPAYACPDLVSAVFFAGAKPILIDLEENSPHPSGKHILNNITANTVAIVAVNFMGLSGNPSQFRDICENNDLFLIYDCAQWFPLDKEYHWPGDFNIISFGRGKPLNLLHGGAVIVEDPAVAKTFLTLPTPKPNAFYKLTQHLKIKLYNLVLQPWIYRFISQLPGLNIGRTLYKPLETITAMSPYYTGLIKHNVDKFRSQKNALPYLDIKITSISHPLLINLVEEERDNDRGYLLRYPILIKDKKVRDQFYEQTRDYGTSLLYQRPLNQIDGLQNILNQATVYPNASKFADHLVTLPCHEDIDKAVIDLIIDKLD